MKVRSIERTNIALFLVANYGLKITLIEEYSLLTEMFHH